MEENPDELQPFFGKYKIESETTIIPSSTGSKLRLDWTCEVGQATNNNTFDYSNRAFETDEADKYFHEQGVKPPKDMDRVYISLDVLTFLYGKPWNNLALNLVMALNPTKIRVTKGSVTCDAMPGRVTVWLEDDGRTIHSIDQEVNCGGIGVKCGEDLHYKMKGMSLPESSDEPNVYSNVDAIKDLKL